MVDFRVFRCIYRWVYIHPELLLHFLRKFVYIGKDYISSTSSCFHRTWWGVALLQHVQKHAVRPSVKTLNTFEGYTFNVIKSVATSLCGNIGKQKCSINIIQCRFVYENTACVVGSLKVFSFIFPVYFSFNGEFVICSVFWEWKMMKTMEN